MTGGSATVLHTVFQRLDIAYGTQAWWPADGPFEVMIGALLTQHTAWRNAEQAIDSLRHANALVPDVLAVLPISTLEELVRTAGTFRAKATRLQALARWYIDLGGYESLTRYPTTALRAALLDLKGVGPETADCILVYVFARPVFIVDGYARRILSRYGFAYGNEPYRRLSTTVAGAFDRDATTLGEFHALLVEHGKRYCRSSPHCTGCPLMARCAVPTRTTSELKLGPEAVNNP